MTAKSTSQNIANFNYLPNFWGHFFKTHWRLLQKENNVLLSKTCRRRCRASFSTAKTVMTWLGQLREAVSGKCHKAPHFQPGFFSKKPWWPDFFGESFHHFFFAIVGKTWNGKKRLATLHTRPGDLDMKPWNLGWQNILSTNRENVLLCTVPKRWVVVSSPCKT